MLEMAINNVEMGSELDRVYILTFCVIFPEDFSLVGSVIFEELGNKQTHRHPIGLKD